MAVGKPIPQLKKFVPPAAMEAFVESDTASTSSAQSAPAAARGSMKSPNGASKKSSQATKAPAAATKKVTYYFPPDLERRLAIYAATNRLKMTNIVVEAVEAFLDDAQK